MDVQQPLGGSYFEVISTAILVGAGLWLLWSWQKKKSSPFQKVGVVSRIFMYPVKSARGMDLKEARCSVVGLQFPGTDICDRSVVITSSDYTVLTLREMPAIALVTPSIHGNKLHLDAPNMETLVVNREAGQSCSVMVHSRLSSAQDCGDKAGDWLTKLLQKEGLRLCVSVPGPETRFVKETEFEPFKTQFQETINDEAKILFADICPYLVTSDAALDDLNSRIGEKLSMRRFRSNIVVSGCPAFDEDNWKVMQIGESRLTIASNCIRCTVTQVDPDTGIRRKDQEPMKTLQKYRLIDPAYEKYPAFGTWWVMDQPGIIRVGDPIYASKV